MLLGDGIASVMRRPHCVLPPEISQMGIGRIVFTCVDNQYFLTTGKKILSRGRLSFHSYRMAKSTCAHAKRVYHPSMTPHPSRRTVLKWGMATAVVAGISPSHAEVTTHSLPALGYAPESLEPHIDAATMTIHHTKHHAAYITKLNEALATQSDLGSLSLDALMTKLPSVSDAALQSTLRNNGGGHWNHSFFWKIMAPAAQCGKPSPELSKAIDASFGSMEKMKAAFADAALKRFGSGWAWLIVKDGTLKITSTPNQDNPLMKGIVADTDLGKPLLGIDVWEHAYYLHYQNRRADYITAWWNVVNWKEVNAMFGS